MKKHNVVMNLKTNTKALFDHLKNTYNSCECDEFPQAYIWLPRRKYVTDNGNKMDVTISSRYKAISNCWIIF